MKRITHDKLLAILIKESKQFSRQYLAADKFGMLPGDFNLVIHGKKRIPDRVAEQLGYQVREVYEAKS